MYKQVSFLSRRNFFFIKFFDAETEKEFLDKVRKINAPGGFVEVLLIEKPASGVYEVHKMDEFEKTWNELACKYMKATEEWYFSWKEYDCIYATQPAEKAVTA